MMMKRRTFLSSLSGCMVAGTGLGASLSTWAGEPGVTSSRITVGCTSSLSGILAGRGTDALVGMNAAFAAINKDGGLMGREIRLVSLDDGYVPARSVSNLKQLIETEGAFALLSCTGTANNLAILPLVEQARLPYVGPMSGANSLRRAGDNYVFHVKASYADEVARMSQQLVKMGLQDVAVVYLDNSFGQEVSKAVQNSLLSDKRKVAAAIAVAADGNNISQVVDQVVASKANVVVLATTGSVSTTVLQALRTRSPGLPIVGISVSVIPSDFEKLGKATQGLALTQVFPDATSGTHESVRAYQAVMRASGHTQFNSTSFEGYVNAMVLAEGLKRTGRDLTREGLRASLASMKKFNLGEYSLGFGAAAPYVASRYVDMAVMGAGGRFLL
jgi:branched-chain amino acid transport system substrate-binding protein